MAPTRVAERAWHFGAHPISDWGHPISDCVYPTKVDRTPFAGGFTPQNKMVTPIRTWRTPNSNHLPHPGIIFTPCHEGRGKTPHVGQTPKDFTPICKSLGFPPGSLQDVPSHTFSIFFFSQDDTSR